MASITSLSNSVYKSNSSSIYGNRNVLSGLASGMDTESMIENAISGYKLKIQNLQKKRTKIEWQQEAYRSITDKAVTFNNKYTSYASKTNLLSSSFFSNAVNTTANGTYADKITATGKTTSDIKINAVKQMATAATYTYSGLGTKYNGDINGIDAASGLDLSKDMSVSAISGSLTIQYGIGNQGASFDLSFDEVEDVVNNGQELADLINKKLGEISYSYSENGFQETTTADKAVKAVYKDGQISFEDVRNKGNKVSVGYVSGDMKDALGIKSGDTTIGVNYDTKLVDTKTTAEYLKGKELSINYNGTTKKIQMDDITAAMEDAKGADNNEKFVNALQSQLDKAFGEGKVKVAQSADSGALSLTPSKGGDTLSLGGSAMKALGFTGDSTNYINTSKKLSELLGEDTFKAENRVAAVGEVTKSSSGNFGVDEKGNRVSLGDDGNYYRVNSDGKFLYEFKINDASINVTEDTTLESLMNSINSSADAGVKVSYSKLTNEFKFTATETGANSKIEFGGLAKDMFDPEPDPNIEINHNFADNYGFFLSDGEKDRITVHFDKFNIGFSVDNKMTMQDFADKMNVMFGGLQTASYNEKTGQLTVTDKETGKEMEFSITDQYGFDYKREIEPVVNGKYTKGQDAVMDVEINGKRFENLTRGSNSFDLDGLTVNVKGTFEAVGKDGQDYEPITFTTATDSDKIVGAIRDFVNDYNEMITELKNAYSTMPAQKTNGERYEPLTAEEEDSLSESELKAYNEKAKQGILFGDSNLSAMYSKLLNTVAPGGADGRTLREIGIDTTYNNGVMTLSLDEDKLRAALDSNPDKVKTAFTKTKEGGSSTDGLMQSMQNVLNTYVKETGEPKGILIQHAGSIKAYASLNNNTLKSQMDSLDTQIERWQDKMSNQIDRYTTKFSKLEQLIAQMNSQSSTFAGLMGGSTGY